MNQTVIGFLEKHGTLTTLAAMFVLIILGFGISFFKDYQDSKYSKTPYVYACPDEGNSKCYKVIVDFAEAECWENEDGFGQPIGECKDPVPNKIFFNNGGSVNLNCFEEEKENWGCLEEGSNKLWDLQFAEIIKTEK